jgi:hypothetical protein
LAVHHQHHLLAAVAFSGRRPLPPGYLAAAAVGVSAAAPLNPCLADPQRLAAAVHQFLEAAEVGLQETTIFATISLQKWAKFWKKFHDKAKMFFKKTWKCFKDMKNFNLIHLIENRTKQVSFPQQTW